MEEEERSAEDRQPAGDGTAAVLYGIFTSFTEALGDLDQRLSAIEAALRTGPTEVIERLDKVESALGRVTSGAGQGPEVDGAAAAMPAMLLRQSELLDQRTAALAAAIESLRTLVQSHVDDTANSLGRRASDVGRRLAGDLGLRTRPKQPPPNP